MPPFLYEAAEVFKSCFSVSRTWTPLQHSDRQQTPQRGLWEWQKLQSPETEQPLERSAANCIKLNVFLLTFMRVERYRGPHSRCGQQNKVWSSSNKTSRMLSVSRNATKRQQWARSYWCQWTSRKWLVHWGWLVFINVINVSSKM